MEDSKDKIIYVSVDDIIPNRFQPRLAFDENELNELANSIIKYGVIQPIVLRNIGEKYEIIAGERRYKASCLAGLKKIPAIINNTDDNTSAEIALLENLQRKNLTPIEESQSYKKLLDRGFTQEEIATKLGISQSSIANKLRLLNLPKKVQDSLLYGKISERHARSLLSLNNKEMQEELLSRIVNERLTVKQTEEEIDKLLNKETKENDIPEEIQKFINKPDEEYTYKPKEENTISKPNNDNNYSFYKQVPDVVNIDDGLTVKNDNKEESSSINPFQENNRQSYDNIYDRLTQNFENYRESRINTNNEVQDEIKEEPIKHKESNKVQRVVSSIRKSISDLDDIKGYITTEEKDLPDRYRIVIEIEKEQ